MKLVMIADTHGCVNPKLPKGDVLIHAGDFCTMGKIQDLAAFVKEMHQYTRQYKSGIIVVAGNHDWICEKEPGIAKHIFEENGVTYLHDDEIVIDGVKFYGTPYQLRFLNWAFNKSETQLEEIYSKIPKDTDVLITHQPPYKILDIESREGNCGSHALRHAMERVKPKVHIFGHIHQSGGNIVKNGETLCINASLLDDEYIEKFKPITVELDN